jgi:hypothetical protein
MWWWIGWGKWERGAANDEAINTINQPATRALASRQRLAGYHCSSDPCMASSASASCASATPIHFMSRTTPSRIINYTHFF